MSDISIQGHDSSITGEQAIREVAAPAGSERQSWQVVFYSGGWQSDKELEQFMHFDPLLSIALSPDTHEGERRVRKWLAGFDHVPPISDLLALAPRRLLYEVLSGIEAVDILVQTILCICGICDKTENRCTPLKKGQPWWWLPDHKGPEIGPSDPEERGSWREMVHHEWRILAERPCRWFLGCLDALRGPERPHLRPSERSGLPQRWRPSVVEIAESRGFSQLARLIGWLCSVRGTGESNGCPVHWGVAGEGKACPPDCFVRKREGDSSVFELLADPTQRNWLRQVHEESFALLCQFAEDDVG
jgi:hypothetical protein